MKIINLATYLYRTSVFTRVDVNGKSVLKHFLFPPFATEKKKVDVSDEDYNLLIAHPNFKYRLDNGLLRIEGELPKLKKLGKIKKSKNKDRVETTNVTVDLDTASVDDILES